MSDELDRLTDHWVLEAKVEAYERALSAALASSRAHADNSIKLLDQLRVLRDGVRGFALTLRDWAVKAGGHTPSAIIASRLLELIGDEKGPPETEADVAMRKDVP